MLRMTNSMLTSSCLVFNKRKHRSRKPRGNRLQANCKHHNLSRTQSTYAHLNASAHDGYHSRQLSYPCAFLSFLSLGHTRGSSISWSDTSLLAPTSCYAPHTIVFNAEPTPCLRIITFTCPLNGSTFPTSRERIYSRHRNLSGALALEDRLSIF